MSIAATSLALAPATTAPTTTGAPARSADGDYKSANPQGAPTKDSDGDYKPLAGSAAAQSSDAVQASLTSLKVGG